MKTDLAVFRLGAHHSCKPHRRRHLDVSDSLSSQPEHCVAQAVIDPAWLVGEDEAWNMSSALRTVLTVYDRADRLSISVQIVYLPVWVARPVCLQSRLSHNDAQLRLPLLNAKRQEYTSGAYM